jgi:hemerythrin superfamily protein
MNAIQLLTEQHDELDALFAKLDKAKGSRAKASCFAELADKLAAHATIEEKIFYPAIKSDRTEDKLAESLEEHLSVKRLLADLVALSPSHDAFEPKVKVLKEQLEHHNHKEEENELFPQVRKMLAAEQLDALGGEMMSLYVSLLASSPRLDVASETDAAAPL